MGSSGGGDETERETKRKENNKIGEKRRLLIKKSYFEVLGLCCSSEVPLIEKILKPLDGVTDVSVIVPSRTVIVLHDPNIISQLQIGTLRYLPSSTYYCTLRLFFSQLFYFLLVFHFPDHHI